MNARDRIRALIFSALKRLRASGVFSAVDAEVLTIEVPASLKFGDYTTNVALRFAAQERKAPMDVARILSEEMEKEKNVRKIIKRIDIAGPGFLNFFLSESFLGEEASNVAARSDYGGSRIGKGAKANVEFLSANPTGAFQIGNGRGAFYGDVLGNILSFASYKVTKEYYINNGRASNQIQELGKTALGLGEKYATADVAGKIAKLQAKLARCKDAGKAGMLLAAEIHKDNENFLRKKTHIHFDVWTEEEELYKNKLPEKTLVFLKKKKLVYEKDGAQWLKTTQFGDDEDKVVVRGTGAYTYYLTDIAYHYYKMKRGFRFIIDVFGADHQGHVKPMEVAMRMLGYKGTFSVLVTQMVQAMGGGKFSKRAGNVIALEELVDKVGIDAARYFYLTRSLDSQMEFDISLAMAQNKKNPVYYIQYTHARISSILRKSDSVKSLGRRRKKEPVQSLEEGERALIIKLIRFPEIIEDIARDYQVHRLTTYVLELAQEFNQFYRDYRVLVDDSSVREARLMLAIASQRVLRNALDILGIGAPERM